MKTLRPRIREIRETRRLSQIALADRIGISRQALSAIEAGRSDPSLSVGLSIARVLGVRVEDLVSTEPADLRVDVLAVGPEEGLTSARMTLAHVRDRWVAHRLTDERAEALFQSADAVMVGRGTKRPRVELLGSSEDARSNVLMLGCAPTLGLLASRLNRARGPGHFVWLQRSSTSSLEGLANGEAHVAGMHLRDPGSGMNNLPAVRKRLPDEHLLFVTFARWESGLVVRRNDPGAPRRFEDFVRPGLRVAAREPGAGARILLDQELARVGIDASVVLRDALDVRGHLEAGFAVRVGAADVAVANRHAALAHDLEFVPVSEERFDLVLTHETARDPRIERMLDLLSTSAFRRDLAGVGGYDATECGRSVTETIAA